MKSKHHNISFADEVRVMVAQTADTAQQRFGIPRNEGTVDRVAKELLDQFGHDRWSDETAWRAGFYCRLRLKELAR